MQYARSGNLIALRVVAGEDVHESITHLCAQQGIKAAFVVSGIGMLSNPELGFYSVEEGDYHRELVEGRHELLNLSGNVSEKDGGLLAHLHVTLSDAAHRVFGGHLFQANVGLTLEVMLAVLEPPVRMFRRHEEQWGLPGLYIES